jgi:hypothetical protein
MDAAAGRIFVLAGEGRVMADAPKAPIGRPSSYSDEAAASLCAHLAEGGLLLDWCRQEGRPSVAAVYRWMEARPEFREAYARAREVGLHVMAEQVIGISDDASRDWKETEDGTALDHEHVQRSRLRVDSRKWLASKLLPKIYGEKAQVQHSGPDGGPIRLTWGDGSS